MDEIEEMSLEELLAVPKPRYERLSRDEANIIASNRFTDRELNLLGRARMILNSEVRRIRAGGYTGPLFCVLAPTFWTRYSPEANLSLPASTWRKTLHITGKLFPVSGTEFAHFCGISAVFRFGKWIASNSVGGFNALRNKE